MMSNKRDQEYGGNRRLVQSVALKRTTEWDTKAAPALALEPATAVDVEAAVVEIHPAGPR